jgi:hypothetical protein
MSPRLPTQRRWAQVVMGQATRIMRPSQSEWADAMGHELSHIENDREALTWAIGCLVASCVEKTRLMNLFHLAYVRWVIALLMGVQALDLLFATVLTLAYRLRYLDLANFLGGFTPGDSYRRFIPLMEATPWWVHALWVAGSALCVLAAWKLLRNRPAAFLLFAAAWSLGAIGDFISHSLPAYQEAFSFPTQQMTRDFLLPLARTLLPVVAAVALWAHGRCAPTTGGSPAAGKL